MATVAAAVAGFVLFKRRRRRQRKAKVAQMDSVMSGGVEKNRSEGGGKKGKKSKKKDKGFSLRSAGGGVEEATPHGAAAAASLDEEDKAAIGSGRQTSSSGSLPHPFSHHSRVSPDGSKRNNSKGTRHSGSDFRSSSDRPSPSTIHPRMGSPDQEEMQFEQLESLRPGNGELVMGPEGLVPASHMLREQREAEAADRGPNSSDGPRMFEVIHHSGRRLQPLRTGGGDSVMGDLHLLPMGPGDSLRAGSQRGSLQDSLTSSPKHSLAAGEFLGGSASPPRGGLAARAPGGSLGPNGSRGNLLPTLSARTGSSVGGPSAESSRDLGSLTLNSPWIHAEHIPGGNHEGMAPSRLHSSESMGRDSLHTSSSMSRAMQHGIGETSGRSRLAMNSMNRSHNFTSDFEAIQPFPNAVPGTLGGTHSSTVRHPAAAIWEE